MVVGRDRGEAGTYRMANVEASVAGALRTHKDAAILASAKQGKECSFWCDNAHVERQLRALAELWALSLEEAVDLALVRIRRGACRRVGRTRARH